MYSRCELLQVVRCLATRPGCRLDIGMRDELHLRCDISKDATSNRHRIEKPRRIRRQKQTCLRQRNRGEIAWVPLQNCIPSHVVKSPGGRMVGLDSMPAQQ